MEQQNTDQKYDTNGCFYHPLKDAECKCSMCGKYLCRDCADAGRIRSGAKTGQSICIECSEKLLEDQLTTMKELKNKNIKFIVRLIIGLIVSLFVVDKLLDFLGLYGTFKIILKVILVGSATIFIASPQNSGERFLKGAAKISKSPFDKVFVKIIKWIVSFLLGIISMFVSGVIEIISEVIMRITMIKNIPDIVEMHTKLLNEIYEYKKYSFDHVSASDENEEVLKEKKEKISQMVTTLVNDREGL